MRKFKDQAFSVPLDGVFSVVFEGAIGSPLIQLASNCEVKIGFN